MTYRDVPIRDIELQSYTRKVMFCTIEDESQLGSIFNDVTRSDKIRREVGGAGTVRLTISKAKSIAHANKKKTKS
jgi:hypothetical protein